MSPRAMWELLHGPLAFAWPRMALGRLDRQSMPTLVDSRSTRHPTRFVSPFMVNQGF